MSSFKCPEYGANYDEYIPSHLGKRWNGLSYEEAKNGWLLKFKKTSVRIN